MGEPHLGLADALLVGAAQIALMEEVRTLAPTDQARDAITSSAMLFMPRLVLEEDE